MRRALERGSDDWIEWKGGAWNAGPVDDRTTIEVRFRDGDTETDAADQFSWDHSGGTSDITHYRVVSTGRLGDDR